MQKNTVAYDMEMENARRPGRGGDLFGQHDLLAFPAACRLFYQTGLRSLRFFEYHTDLNRKYCNGTVFALDDLDNFKTMSDSAKGDLS